MHHQLTRGEAAQVRRQFTMTLCNLEQVELYWSPSTRRIMARKLNGLKRPLPADALLVGIYEHGFKSHTFVEDVEDLIAGLAWVQRHQARTQTAQGASA